MPGFYPAPLSFEHAQRRADDLWQGVYSTRRDRDGWVVTLHGPAGPRHYLDHNGAVDCAHSHGCATQSVAARFYGKSLIAPFA